VLADITREVTTREDITEPLVIAPEESDAGIWNSRGVPQQFAEADAEDTLESGELSSDVELNTATNVFIDGHWNSKDAQHMLAELDATSESEDSDYA